MQSHRVAATSFATVSLLAIYLVTMVPNFTAAPAAETRYVSAIGEIRTVILEDLSSIDLGANSEIKVQFSDSSRQIELY